MSITAPVAVTERRALLRFKNENNNNNIILREHYCSTGAVIIERALQHL
jgi:hypothetical protein